MASKVPLKVALEQSQDITIRMFKNEFLERLSHVHPATPFVFYIPILGYFGFSAFYYTGISILNFLIYFGYGLLFWTIGEYLLHRFVFHPPQTNEFLRKLYFYIHGIHHDAVKDATRLVMPLSVSIPLAFGVYFGFKALFGVELFLPAFIGFVAGYLVYDFLHFATHFLEFNYRWFKFIKKNHMRHHFNDPNKNFGFTSPVWDIVFFTYYKKK